MEWNSKIINLILIVLAIVALWWAVTTDDGKLIPASQPKAKPTVISKAIERKPEVSPLTEKLLQAALKGNAAEIETLLEQGANVNAKDNKGLTSLHYATRTSTSPRERHKAVDLLISRGANVNANDGKDMTPLHLTVISGSVEITKLLIANGANVNALGAENLTPLHCLTGSRRIEMAELLISNGANVNFKKDVNKMTPLDMAILNRDIVVAKFLILHGANAEGDPKSGLRPLHTAVMQNNKTMTDLLLAHGADVNDEGAGGIRPLDLARGQLAEYLKSLGAKPGIEIP